MPLMSASAREMGPKGSSMGSWPQGRIYMFGRNVESLGWEYHQCHGGFGDCTTPLVVILEASYAMEEKVGDYVFVPYEHTYLRRWIR